MKELKDITNLS